MFFKTLCSNLEEMSQQADTPADYLGVYQTKFVPSCKREHRTFKICLYGEGAVGKTSLILRFVKNMYSDKYAKTIGTDIYTKKVLINHPTESDKVIEATLNIWDIMGQMGFSDLLKKKHFEGAHGAIGVADITRKETLDDKTGLGGLAHWTDSLYETVGKIPVIILANKCDLGGQAKFGKKELEEFKKKYNTEYGLTSAKTGEHVEDVFKLLTEVIARAQ